MRTPEALHGNVTKLGGALDQLQDIRDVFSQAVGFCRFSHSDTALLCRSTTIHAAGRNQVLLHQGARPDHMIILLTGEARMTSTSQSTHAQVLKRIRPGMAVGVLAMLDRGTMQSACVSTTPVDFMRLERETFSQLALTQPRLATQLLVALMHGLASRDDEVQGASVARQDSHTVQINSA